MLIEAGGYFSGRCALNKSLIGTVVVCALTSKTSAGSHPGNVTLRRNEAGLPKKSVVNISQIITVDKNDLDKKIGSVTAERLNEVLDGVNLLLSPKDTD